MYVRGVISHYQLEIKRLTKISNPVVYTAMQPMMCCIHTKEYKVFISFISSNFGNKCSKSTHPIMATLHTGVIFIKHLRKKLKLRENFGTELQQNQRTLQILKIMVGCRFNSVS